MKLAGCFTWSKKNKANFIAHVMTPLSNLDAFVALKTDFPI